MLDGDRERYPIPERVPRDEGLGGRGSTMRNWFFGLMFCALIVGCAEMTLAAGPEGLVGFWRFDEGSGATARDSSGSGNHGEIVGATFVKRGEGHALRFDEETDLVEVAAAPSLDVGSAGTISLWFHPDEVRGGLLSYGPKGEGARTRLALGFDTRTPWGEPGNELRLWAGNGTARYTQTINDPREGDWNHLALAIDGRRIMCYRDGAPEAEITLPITINVKDLPFVIGRFVIGQEGKAVLSGMIDQVRMYNRPLSSKEVLAEYRKDAASFGKDATLFKRPTVMVEVLPDPARIVARTQCALMGSLPKGATIEVALSKPDEEQALASRKQPVDPDGREMILNLDVAKLPAAKYRVRAIVRKPDGESFGDPSEVSVEWSGQTEAFRGVRILNNFVWELINEEPGVVEGVKEYRFVQPKRRWVYVACTAAAPGRKLSVSIDDAAETRDIIVIEPGTETKCEAMRFLPAGEHTLTLRAEGPVNIDRLVVRSIPELLFTNLIVNPHVKPFGPYDSAFMKECVVPNVNAFVLSQDTKPPRWEEPLFKDLQGRGIRWYHRSSVPGRSLKSDPVTVQQVYDYVVARPGLNREDLHGTMVDEFGVSRPFNATYAEALRQLYAEPRFKGKVYYPYVGRLYTGSDGRELVKALMEADCNMALKRYLQVRHTERAAYDFAHGFVLRHIRKFRDICPGSVDHLTICFGYFTVPVFGLNVVPHVNFKSFLDMEFNIVANAPECWGAYGLMSYQSNYVDEETIRWMAQLYRHYGIEGATERASSDPYDDSRLLANGDFDVDTNHWTLSPAEPGSIRRVQERNYSYLQGRYHTTPQGNTALLMVRSDKKPNSFSQTIKNLEPGRMYTFRMITGEYQDRSKGEKHAVSIKLDGVEIIPERSFSYVYRSRRSTKENPTWLDYHWILFRAKSATATVTVSDWVSENDPGGPIGQGLMYNFLQVHPYLER